jgi:hypothetical protein
MWYSVAELAGWRLWVQAQFSPYDYYANEPGILSQLLAEEMGWA